MSITVLVIVVIVALILLFVVAKIIKGCLPKIIGVVIVAGLAYLAYYLLTR